MTLTNSDGPLPDVYVLLERVVDRDSLIVFVDALAAERADAASLESDEPLRYSLGGANDWANADIPSFLDGACEYLRHHVSDGETPTWRTIAEFLWCGKIME